MKRTNMINFNIPIKKQKMNNTEIIKEDVIIYCRVSTKNQSLEAQEFSCKDYCQNNNYNILKIIHEVGSAYKNIKLYKLENIIKNNCNKILLIYSIDRFSRNLTKCDELLQLINKNKIILKSVKEEIDLSTPLGRHNFRNYVSQAQFESELISERIKNTLNYKKINTPKYGYHIKNNETIINKEEKAILTFIYNNYNKKINSYDFTNNLFKLFKILKKDKLDYVIVDFYNGEDIIENNKPINITSGILSNILNEYDVLIRNKKWSEYKIRNIYNNFINIDKLTL